MLTEAKPAEMNLFYLITYKYNAFWQDPNIKLIKQNILRIIFYLICCKFVMAENWDLLASV